VYEAPHGSQEMPIWGPFFSELSPKSEALGTLRITNIVKYIQSLQVSSLRSESRHKRQRASAGIREVQNP